MRYDIQLTTLPGLAEWRDAARRALSTNLAPHQLIWHSPEDNINLNLFAQALPEISNSTINLRVPKAFMEAVQCAICHSSIERYALLYRILWRLTHENKDLMHYQTDDDILQLQALVQQVRRDAYKIKAFLRFRETSLNGISHFISWYEPEHYTLELSLPFFQTRFKNMQWTILTPYRAAQWNGQQLVLSDNPNPDLHPDKDKIEQYWIQYYATTFNPARLKIKAMLNQMPKKYWKNMPETLQIQSLINGADSRVQKMLAENQPC